MIMKSDLEKEHKNIKVQRNNVNNVWNIKIYFKIPKQ